MRKADINLVTRCFWPKIKHRGCSVTSFYLFDLTSWSLDISTLALRSMLCYSVPNQAAHAQLGPREPEDDGASLWLIPNTSWRRGSRTTQGWRRMTRRFFFFSFSFRVRVCGERMREERVRKASPAGRVCNADHGGRSADAASNCQCNGKWRAHQSNVGQSARRPARGLYLLRLSNLL